MRKETLGVSSPHTRRSDLIQQPWPCADPTRPFAPPDPPSTFLHSALCSRRATLPSGFHYVCAAGIRSADWREGNDFGVFIPPTSPLPPLQVGCGLSLKATAPLTVALHATVPFLVTFLCLSGHGGNNSWWFPTLCPPPLYTVPLLNSP